MIHRLIRPLAALIVGVVFLSSGALALGHGAALTVQPASARPGDTITLTGEDMGASRDVDVKLAGTGVDVKLGHADTDEDGAFTEDFKLPGDLRPGQYVVSAEGEETVTADLTIVTGAAGAAGEAMTGAAPAFEPRARPFEQVLALVVVFGVLSGIGLFLARFGFGGRGPQETQSVVLPEVERA